MNPIVQELLSGLELAIEKMINDKADLLLDQGIEALKKAIPGVIDDMLLETVKPQVKLAAKQAALGLVNKLDGKEG